MIRWFARLIRGLLRLVVAVVVLVALVSGGLTVYFRYATPFHQQLISDVQARVAAYHIHPISYGEIPVVYRKAIIATEDRRFWSDPGIDPVGIARSILVDVQRDGYLEGGSTITQQVVDNTLIQRGRTLHYKLQQMLYAIGLYDTVSKRQTLDLYVNMIYFGDGAYGLYNAAMTYFGKTPGQLNAGELTMLAGLPNAPSVYDPLRNFSLARERQSIVLENMVDDHMISSEESKQIYAEPIQIQSAG